MKNISTILILLMSFMVMSCSSKEKPLVPTITTESVNENVKPEIKTKSRIKIIESKKVRNLFTSSIIEIDGHEYSVIQSSRGISAGITQLHLESCHCKNPKIKKEFSSSIITDSDSTLYTYNLIKQNLYLQSIDNIKF